MKFSENWLRQWIKTDLDRDALAQQLTLQGLEVDSVTPVAGDFEGVMIGEVLSTIQHPDADRLKVCDVVLSLGAEPVKIVCGGANVRAGLKVPVATVGGSVGDIKIKKAKIRGVESNGMICSESELGLAESSQGIMELEADAPVGINFKEYYQLNDSIIDIELTANRGDCASILGIARDLAAATNIHIIYPTLKSHVATHQTKPFNMTIEAQDECPRYTARIVKNIQKNIASPRWLQEILRRSGLRPIHPVVDLTNYLLFELGQPMHVFDLEKIQGDVCIRLAKQGEQLTLLNGQTIQLKPTTLIIADQKQPLALAGVMGGLYSSVTAETTDILIESAYFTPKSTRQTTKDYQLNTDGSYRFERGVDFSLFETEGKAACSAQIRTIERYTQLLLEIVGGEVGPTYEVTDFSKIPVRKKIKLRKERIKKILGITIPDQKVIDYFQRLQMEKITTLEDGWEMIPPGHRFDCEIEVDLIEELARLHGYQRIENQLPTFQTHCLASPEKVLHPHRIRQFFVDRGFTEIRSYSFVEESLEAFISPSITPKKLLNPISSEMSVMRSTLLPGLLQTLAYNTSRQQSRVRLFEIGMVFEQTSEQLLQNVHLGGMIFGTQLPEQWGSAHREADFFDLKGDLVSLFALTANPSHFTFVSNTHPGFHPSQCAQVMYKNQPIGWCGQVHPSLLKKLDIRGNAFCFDLSIACILEKALPNYQPISKFPEVRRDIAVVVEEKLPVQQLIDTIRSKSENLLQHVEIFDIYSGQGVTVGKKSIAIALTFQRVDRTLTDTEVNELVALITSTLSDQCGATLR